MKGCFSIKRDVSHKNVEYYNTNFSEVLFARFKNLRNGSTNDQTTLPVMLKYYAYLLNVDNIFNSICLSTLEKIYKVYIQKCY